MSLGPGAKESPPSPSGPLAEAAATDLEDRREGTLYVDLDGTLLCGDTLWECVARLLLRPHRLFGAPVALLRGRAALKGHLVRDGIPDAAGLPYRPEVVAFLQSERARGRRVVLATGCHESLAHAVAAHLGVFDGVLATDARCNLTGDRKRERIAAHAAGPFDYVGNSAADLPVWAAARRAYAVAAPARVLRRLEAGRVPVEHVAVRRASSLAAVWRALRPHQWAKNLLVFVPLALTPAEALDPARQLLALLAFVAFSAVASAGYLVNDLLDLESDRSHPVKRGRPLASGSLSIPSGIALSLGLAAAGFGAALLLLPLGFTGVLTLYLVGTLAYSVVIKRLLLLDVITLAGLYTVRVIAGSAAVGIELTPWLLAFSLFIFLSLAFAKRYSELHLMASRREARARGRAYHVEDLELVAVLGATSGYLSVLVLCLYINSGRVRELYPTAEALWLLAPILLYWISRIWFLAKRGELPGDPVAFAVRDPVSWCSGLAMLVVIGLAIA